MEVIQVYHHDPCDKGKGGAVRYLTNLLKYLPQKGVSTTLLGVKYVNCNSHIDFQFKPVIKGSNEFLWYFLNLFLKMPFLKISNQAIIHAHRIEYVIPFVLFKRNNPVILTLHGERLATGKTLYSKSLFFIISNIYKFVEYLALKRANFIVAVSEEVKNSFLDNTTDSNLNVKVIPVGVDLNEFRPLNKKITREKYNLDLRTKVILFVGVLGKIKNLKLLITSFSLFASKFPDSVLLIVGDGSEKSYLEQLACELSISTKVKFLGEVHNENLPEIYNIADIFAFTSKSEGSPTVIREALACGIPIVSTDVGDVKNIIRNSAGLISADNVGSFSKSLIKISENIGTDKCKVKCLKAVEPYSFDFVAEQYIKIYLKMRSLNG